MKATQFATLIAGAASGAVLSFLVFAGDAPPREPAGAQPAPTARAEPRPLRRPRPTPDTPAAKPSRDEALHPVATLEPAAARPLSDADLSSWMDTSLDSGYSDRARSGLASEQVEDSLAEFPGVRLTDVQCGSDFCRASLQAEPGTAVDVSRLFGLPPFAFSSGGFSVEEPGGATKIYFVRAGQSLDALRVAARGAF